MRTDRADLRSSGVTVPAPRPPTEDAGDVPPGEGRGGDDLGELFVGRDRELAVLGSVTRQVRDGRPRVVRIEGPAGIGKTTLVERFLQGQSDLLVLRCAGEREEASVGFGLIDQLFLGSGGTSVRLLLSGGSGMPYFAPNVVGERILTFLGDHQEKGPIVLVVDDLQWADSDSLRALLFALRRMAAERVLTLLMTRDEADGPAEGLCRLAAHRDGAVLQLRPLTVRDVRSLACAVGNGRAPAGLMTRVHSHTRGNPGYLRDVLNALAEDRWCGGELPVPRAVAQWVRHAVEVCTPEPRRLVEAASVLGDGSRLSLVGSLAETDDPLATLDVARAAGLLDVSDEQDGRHVRFPHPLVQASVYRQLGPARRVRLHLAAAELVGEDGSRFRHRIAAADPPDEGLAAELSAFARRQAEQAAWSGAASAMAASYRMSGPGRFRERRRLQAVDLLAGIGDLDDADALAGDGAAPGRDALADAVAGHRAVLEGRRDAADALLQRAWERCEPDRDAWTAAFVAERKALHDLGRLRPDAVVDWAGRAVALAPAGDALAGRAAEALLDIGLVWAGRAPRCRTAHAGAAPPGEGPMPGPAAAPEATDDVTVAMAGPADVGRGGRRVGWIAHRVWSSVWASQARFLSGSWDEAAVAAAQAVELVEDAKHRWLLPLARWAAVGVPAARGEWEKAEEHARSAAASGGYELMVVPGGLARAQLAAARGDHDEVLGALGPVAELSSCGDANGSGLWPWPELYADALVNVGRLEDAAAFLAPQEELAAVRGCRLGVAALARVRGRLESAAGRAEAAEVAFGRALGQLEGLSVPFPRALVELSFGQVLRRHGHRRAAAEQLELARARFAGLGARPYVARCERELDASGLAPAKRQDFDPSRLTAQEVAVAGLVARGLSNRQVASELFVSVKTVQFHLTRIYAKLCVRSRVELAATYAGRTGAD